MAFGSRAIHGLKGKAYIETFDENGDLADDEALVLEVGNVSLRINNSPVPVTNRTSSEDETTGVIHGEDIHGELYVAVGNNIFKIITLCGNGAVNAGEQCDAGAGNGGASSCCTTACQFKPNGNASCDGNHCTRPDTCTNGVCTSGTCAAGNGCTICGGTCVNTGGGCECQ